MRLGFVIVIAIHALIHLLGVAKGFGLARMPTLSQPISVALGVVWLAAMILLSASLVALFAWPRWWWATGAVGHPRVVSRHLGTGDA